MPTRLCSYCERVPYTEPFGNHILRTLNDFEHSRFQERGRYDRDAVFCQSCIAKILKEAHNTDSSDTYYTPREYDSSPTSGIDIEPPAMGQKQSRKRKSNESTDEREFSRSKRTASSSESSVEWSDPQSTSPLRSGSPKSFLATSSQSNTTASSTQFSNEENALVSTQAPMPRERKCRSTLPFTALKLNQKAMASANRMEQKEALKNYVRLVGG